MKIANNIPALQTTAAIGKANKKISASSLRLSTGLRINSARDDAAGLAVAHKLQLQIDGLNMGSRNASDGISMVQTADGALTEVNNMLQRMRELAVQSANGTLETEDRQKIQTEIEGLRVEITDISNRTEFNKIKLLNGQASRLGFSNTVPAGTVADGMNVAKVSYVSDTVGPGQLQYTIDSVGLPAQIKATPAFTAATFGERGRITLNGEPIDINASDTPDDILKKLQDAASVVGATVLKNTTGELVITTNEAGSRQSLAFDGDAAVLAALNLGVSSIQGTDAVISNVNFYDKGDPNNANTNFANTNSLYINGNRVEVNASNGQKISLDIQVEMNDEGYFKLKDNTWISFGGFTDPVTGTNILAAFPSNIKMTADIQDYGPLKLQIGPNYQMEMEISIPKLTADSLGLTYLNYQTQDSATLALQKVDGAISEVAKVRAKLGAYQNRLEYTVLGLDATTEATELSRSRIEDTDMAKETTAYTLQNVVMQAGISVLAQCNERPQQILSLMR